MASDPKATKESVVRLVELLHRVLNSPHEFIHDDYLKAAVKSQIKLAAYSDADRFIYGSSLNTFKKITAGFGEGFEGIENLRVLVGRAFAKQKPRKNKPGSRRTLQEDKANLLKVVASQDADLQRMNLVICSLSNLSRELA